jgi:hypothetical protein
VNITYANLTTIQVPKYRLGRRGNTACASLTATPVSKYNFIRERIMEMSANLTAEF